MADQTPIPAGPPTGLLLVVLDLARAAAAVASRRWESTPNRYAYIHAEISRAALDAAERAYAAGLAAGRTAAAEDLTAIFEKKAQEYRSQPGNWGEACDWDAAATICEDYADPAAARIAENGADPR